MGGTRATTKHRLLMDELEVDWDLADTSGKTVLEYAMETGQPNFPERWCWLRLTLALALTRALI